VRRGRSYSPLGGEQRGRAPDGPAARADRGAGEIVRAPVPSLCPARRAGARLGLRGAAGLSAAHVAWLRRAYSPGDSLRSADIARPQCARRAHSAHHECLRAGHPALPQPMVPLRSDLARCIRMTSLPSSTHNLTPTLALTLSVADPRLGVRARLRVMIRARPVALVLLLLLVAW